MIKEVQELGFHEEIKKSLSIMQSRRPKTRLVPDTETLHNIIKDVHAELQDQLQENIRPIGAYFTDFGKDHWAAAFYNSIKHSAGLTAPIVPYSPSAALGLFIAAVPPIGLYRILYGDTHKNAPTTGRFVPIKKNTPEPEVTIKIARALSSGAYDHKFYEATGPQRLFRQPNILERMLFVETATQIVLERGRTITEAYECLENDLAVVKQWKQGDRSKPLLGSLANAYGYIQITKDPGYLRKLYQQIGKRAA